MLAALREQLPELAKATVRAIAAGDASYDVSTTGAAESVRELRDEVENEAEEIGEGVKKTAKRATRTTQRTTRKAAGTARRTTVKAADKAEKTANQAADKVEKATDGTTSNGDLPIKNYDELNAGEINTRLSTLSPAELRRVETYEKNHAKRSTVLERIDSLKQSA